ncbi:MAG: helix-turn-helix domain-containing protein [Clostridiales Family XIII bacterium]|jgi:transcriptional regulator with XRE-family HTH domain|nr:helix-turn-helix domain-containing protein [Clostridiales Family XIII bacterium]
MDLQEVIVEIREKNGLSQEEMANKLFVTRQAVSRWEHGETYPTIETLKAISKTFEVDIATLLGLQETPICQSCAMPIQNIDDFGTNADDTVTTEYCSHCYKGGSFTHNRTVEEMIESNLRFLDAFNAENGTAYSEEEARSIFKAHLLTLKRWQNRA